MVQVGGHPPLWQRRRGYSQSSDGETECLSFLLLLSACHLRQRTLGYMEAGWNLEAGLPERLRSQKTVESETECDEDFIKSRDSTEFYKRLGESVDHIWGI